MFSGFSVLSVDIWVAFAAGVAAFFTPCILPVIPGFVAYFIADPTGRVYRTVVSAIGFWAGLSFVFVNLGVFSAYLGTLIGTYRGWINVVAGIIIIIFGMHTAGILKVPFIGKLGFNVKAQNRGKGFWSAFLLGLTFSVVWTPCLSPTLGAILVMVSGSPDMFRGAYLLFFYSLGMGLLFVSVAVALKKLMFLVSAMQRYQRKVEVAAGIMLMIVGVIMAFGQFDRLSLIL